jgi:hypothetical protein
MMMQPDVGSATKFGSKPGALNAPKRRSHNNIPILKIYWFVPSLFNEVLNSADYRRWDE